MHENVKIRSNKYGLEVHLNPDIPFEELVMEVKHKFEEAGSFFKDSSLAISFEERALSRTEETKLIELISDTANIHIVCIIDNNKTTEQIYRSIVEQSQEDIDQRDGLFYKGTLKRRQLLETDSSVIIIGDVERGAKVVSKGNIVILGALKGSAYAGVTGDKDAFVIALQMNPQKLKIAETEWRHNSSGEDYPQIASLDGEHIYLDPLNI